MPVKWICGELPATETYDFIFSTPPLDAVGSIVRFTGARPIREEEKWYLNRWVQAIAHLKDNRMVVVRIPRTCDDNGMPLDFEGFTTRLMTGSYSYIDDDCLKTVGGLNLKYYNRAVLYGPPKPDERLAQSASLSAPAWTALPPPPEGLSKAENAAFRRLKQLEKEQADKLVIEEAKAEFVRLFNESVFKHEPDWSSMLIRDVTWESTLFCFFKGDDDKKIPQELGVLETAQEGLATKPMENVQRKQPQNIPDSTGGTLETAVEESFPEFPRLTGALGRVVDAITPDIPYEHKALTVLTYAGLKISGRVRFAPPYRHLQPRFYACLVGPFGSGKSAAQEEVSRALSELPGVHVEFSVDSGPALVEALEEHSHLLYMPDELSDALQKARHGKLLGQLLRLYEHNETGRRVVNKNGGPTKLTNVHFAMVASATPEGFRDTWQGFRGRGSGLQSRFVLAFSEKRMPTVRTPNDEPALEKAVRELADVLDKDDPQEIAMDPECIDLTYFAFEGAAADALALPRVVDMGRRFALILAACNGLSEIDEETAKLAVEFSYYQRKVFERLMPDDASNPIQALENRIIRFFQKHKRANHREVRNHIKPEYSPGGFRCFNQAFDSLVRSGKLKGDGSNRAGKEIWKLDE
jgi:hypothetical protein